MSVLLFYSALYKLLFCVNNVRDKSKFEHQNKKISRFFLLIFSFVYYKPNTPFTKM